MIGALILGIIQGLTEFLPVSSKTHLIFAGYFFKIGAQGVTFDALLHFGTLLALVVFFYKKIWQIIKSFFVWKDRENLRLGLYIILASVPIVVAGVVAKKPVERAFENSPHVVFYAALLLAVTGLILFFTRAAREKRSAIRWTDALVIGLVQVAALLPGISRSGVTVATALYLGLTRENAFEFSFLLSIPAILGAFLMKVKDANFSGLAAPSALAGIGAAFGFGLLAIFLVKKIVIVRKFYLFGIYCVAMALVVLVALRYYH